MTRNSNLYISAQTMRGLRWAARSLQIESYDALADQWLAERLLAEFPNINALSESFDRQRHKLENEFIENLSKSANPPKPICQ